MGVDRNSEFVTVWPPGQATYEALVELSGALDALAALPESEIHAEFDKRGQQAHVQSDVSELLPSCAKHRFVVIWPPEAAERVERSVLDEVLGVVGDCIEAVGAEQVVEFLETLADPPGDEAWADQVLLN